MVWYWAGPDAIVAAAKALGSGERRRSQAGRAGRTGRRPWPTPASLSSVGALDFAGGTVVHINSGIAGLVGALCVGKRVGFGKEPCRRTP